MEEKYLSDLFPGVSAEDFSLPYHFFRRMERKEVPEIQRRRAPASPAPKHQCMRLPIDPESKIVGSLPLHGSPQVKHS
jgi:hypothetical protein